MRMLLTAAIFYFVCATPHHLIRVMRMDDCICALDFCAALRCLTHFAGRCARRCAALCCAAVSWFYLLEANGGCNKRSSLSVQSNQTNRPANHSLTRYGQGAFADCSNYKHDAVKWDVLFFLSPPPSSSVLLRWTRRDCSKEADASGWYCWSVLSVPYAQIRETAAPNPRKYFVRQNGSIVPVVVVVVVVSTDISTPMQQQQQQQGE